MKKVIHLKKISIKELTKDIEDVVNKYKDTEVHFISHNEVYIIYKDDKHGPKTRRSSVPKKSNSAD